MNRLTKWIKEQSIDDLIKYGTMAAVGVSSLLYSAGYFGRMLISAGRK